MYITKAPPRHQFHSTMKTLLLLRHAKSDWSHQGQRDHDRTLNPRGRRDAPRMGRLLQAQTLQPDMILCSSAKRARKTAKLVVEGGDLQATIEVVSDLYLAPPETYVEVLHQQGADGARILMVGHNPGIERFANRLTGAQEAFPTAALAEIGLEIDEWSELSLDTPGRLRNFWRPRELDQ